MLNKIEKFRWLAGLIYAHPGHKLHGRIRLQKEVWLLQRLGMPTDYDFRIHHYGIYSEGVQSNIGLIERFGFIDEEMDKTGRGNSYSVFAAKEFAHLPEIEEFRGAINRMESVQPTILELAATYDAYRDAGLGHKSALAELKRKKPDKCTEVNLQQSFSLLEDLELPFD